MGADEHPEPARASGQTPGSTLVYLLGVYLLVKSAALLAIGIWIAQPIHKGSAASTPTEDRVHVLRELVSYVHLDPDGRFLGKLLGWMGGIQTSDLEAIRWGCWFYAALHIVEGIGLIGRWRWGEWMVVVATTALIPYELWHAYHRPSWEVFSVISINVAIALYFVHRLRIHAEKAIHLGHHHAPPHSPPEHP